MALAMVVLRLKVVVVIVVRMSEWLMSIVAGASQIRMPSNRSVISSCHVFNLNMRFGTV